MKNTARKIATALVVAAMFAVFSYGSWRFPDAPITRRNDGTYHGKFNQTHTAAEFDDYIRWSNVFQLTWPVGMILVAVLNPELLNRKKPSF